MTKQINRITRDDVDSFTHASKDQAAYDYNVFDQYQRTATKSAIYPGQGTPLGLAYVALKLNGEAGEFAEHVGKAMRDDNFIPIEDDAIYGHDVGPHILLNECVPMSQERKSLIIKEIGDVLWYLSAACNELNITLSEAALINLEKLCDRSERDALRGSGDNR